MTAPVLAHKKFWIVKPLAATNQIKNPAFDLPDGKEDWAAQGAGVTLANTTAYQRRGANCMQVNPASNVASGAYYAGLTVVSGSTYTFSCDVKGVAGQAMRIYIADVAGTAKATKTFTATGYWQRFEISHTSAASIATYRAYIIRDSVASTAAYYVDGAQFETASKASTFFDGNSDGCVWSGLPRNSASTRSALTRSGGELVDLDTYCDIVSAAGLGNGQWNQITTELSSGGDMYQGAIRTARKFSIVVDFLGDTLGEMETNRAALIAAMRPDMLDGQEMVVRYQGFDPNGVEATQPVDIVCVPLPSLNDTPTIPSWQRAKLDFAIPSGLLDGGYDEAITLSYNANFPAEYIVKRDPAGKWCTWDGNTGASLITGLNGTVYCLAEGPDGKIYAGGAFTDAGGVANADYLARWNGTAWEAVGVPNTGTASITYVYSMVFDAGGNLYVGGEFVNFGGIANADYFAKWDGSNWSAIGSGIDGLVATTVINNNGIIYIGGIFTTAGGDTNCNHIAYYDTTTSNWKPIGTTGLNDYVFVLQFAPNGDLYIGGQFTDAAYPKICYKKATENTFNPVGVAGDIGNTVMDIEFDNKGLLYLCGQFQNAGGLANADYIVVWNGTSWAAIPGEPPNDVIASLSYVNNQLYVSGDFTTVGGLTLTDRVAIWFSGAWQSLDIDLPGSARVTSVVPASDGSLYIGGVFSTAAETPDVNATCAYTSPPPTVTSSANTYPTIEIVGPGALNGIVNYSTGANVQFDGLTLLAGERLTLQFEPTNLKFTSSWSGRGSVLRYVTPGSDYGNFYLKPGANNVSLFMTGTTAASSAIIRWKPKFWGLDGALL